MSKQYLDLSKVKLDESGRTILHEERLVKLGTSAPAGAGIWDDFVDWWNTNSGSCRNTTFCDEENNTTSCSNVTDCFNSSNASTCTNNSDCTYGSNFVQCRNTTAC